MIKYFIFIFILCVCVILGRKSKPEMVHNSVSNIFLVSVLLSSSLPLGSQAAMPAYFCASLFLLASYKMGTEDKSDLLMLN